MHQFELDPLDPVDFSLDLSAVALKLRTIITEEVGGSPEKYTEVLNPEQSDTEPAIEAMRAIVANINDGTDLREQYAAIARLTHNQDARAEIFTALIQTHDFNRLVKFLGARHKIEAVLLAIADKGKLTPGESLAMLQYLEQQVKDIEKKTQANSISGKDVAALLSKIDYLVDTQQQTMQAQMAHTTPQNREIMRRVATKLLKAAKVGQTKN